MGNFAENFNLGNRVRPPLCDAQFDVYPLFDVIGQLWEVYAEI